MNNESNLINLVSEISNNGDFIDSIGADFYDNQIEKLEADIRTDKMYTVTLRILFLISFICFAVDAVSSLIDWVPRYVSIPLSIFSLLMVIASLGRQNKQISLQSEIRSLQKRRRRFEENLGITQNESKNAENKTNRYFDTLVDINLKNLGDYYDLVKNSNKRSFYASLGVSILGFVLIASGLVVSYITNDSEDIAYISGAAGVIIEIVSGLMFYLYSKTILQLKEYHDSLLNVQNMLLSFKLFEDHKESFDTTEIMKKMIDHLFEVKERIK
ncbi:MAG: hypothetical protein K6T94_22535 [Paenibacillus sp.]|nr:hypothetical protein [Paenibacillus sp.]